MTIVALSTGSLYTYGLARVFDLAAEAGFDAVEILADQRLDSRQPAYLRRLMQESGLPIAAIHSPFPVISTPGWPQDPLDRLRESAALAREVGAPVVVTHLPLRGQIVRVELLGAKIKRWLLPIFVPPKPEYRQFLLNGLAEFETKEKIHVGVENMPARRILGRQINPYFFNDLETLAGFPHLTLDTTHIGTWGLDLLEVYEQLKTRISHVHLSNFDGQEHRLPEDGHLPLAELLRRLTRDGYQGAATVEVGPEVLEAEDEGLVHVHLQRAVQFFREHTAR